jgi:hypothetical protein
MTEWIQLGASEVLQSLTALGVGAVIKYVKGINTRLDTLNGSVAKLKDWSLQHEKKDTKRFNQMMKGRRR